MELYRANCSNRPSTLDRLAVQFADYARWQRQSWHSQRISKQLEYWRTQLAGQCPLNWPSGGTRPARETFRGKIRQFALPRPLTEQVKALSRQQGTTLFVTLLAALATLINRYSQQDDFVLGTPSSSGRKRPEVQSLLGYFLTPVALRFQLTKNLTFEELSRKAQRLSIEAVSNDDIPLEILARELNMNVSASRNPLFQIAISLQPVTPKLDLDWRVTSMDIDSGGAPWDLYLAFIDGENGMMGRAQYNPDLFDTTTIVAMLEQYQQLLEIVVANPHKLLSEIKFSSS
jgi:non-ribosomal peptide synthetase component F